MSNDDHIEVLAETKFLRLVQEGPWTFAQRPNQIGAIAVAAVTDAGELVLVDQYRIPIKSNVIELPAGLVGDDTDGESSEVAARRELLEETGFVAQELKPLTNAVSSGGLTDEMVELWLARGLHRAAQGGGVGAERITVHVISLQDVAGWLDQQRQAGKQIDYKVFAALYFLTNQTSHH